MAVFPPLLAPVFWERHGNVPALSRLLVAYLSKAGQEIVAGGEAHSAPVWLVWLRPVRPGPRLVHSAPTPTPPPPPNAPPPGHLTALLGVFQKLIASKSNDLYGFALLRGILQHLPPPAYQQYMPTVW
jgi:exportin-2 (importin alpha re-exporter)